MSVRVVLDYPDRHLQRRVRRGVSALIGSLMILVGLAAVPTVILLIFLGTPGAPEDAFRISASPVRTVIIALEASPVRTVAIALWAGSGTTLTGASGIALLITLLGTRVGLRLIRGKRKLVLFLRHFGFSEATRALTFAAAKTIGRTWRLVTLDDAAIAPVGVRMAPGMRSLFRAGRFTMGAIVRAWWFVMKATMLLVISGSVGMFCLVVITLLRHEDLTRFWPGPLVNAGEAMSWDIRVFYILFLVTVFAASVGVFVSLLTVALVPFFLIWNSLWTSFEAVRRAEESKAVEIRSADEIEAVTGSVVKQSSHVFSPRLVVMKVASSVWQLTVLSLASVTWVPLIDVSEPTENLLWEIQELSGQFGSRWVLVGHYDRVRQLAADAKEAPSPGAFIDRLLILLDGQEVLAYTTDQPGIKRFARALQAKLQTLSG